MQRKWFAGVAALGLGVAALSWFSIRPSNDRAWAADQAHLATATIDGSVARITNVRRFDHCPDGAAEAVERWESRAYDLEALDSVWLALSLFKKTWRGPAHPFLTFGFADTSFVAISVEARRETDESYSIWWGMAKRFELTYVVADERDILPLRGVCRDDRLYLYPIGTTPDKARALFRGMLSKVNELSERPEFYHTVWNNCTTTILGHANEVAENRIPGGWRTVLPGYSDEIVYSLGLLGTSGSIEEARGTYRVEESIRRWAGTDEFSIAIRRDTGSRGE